MYFPTIGLEIHIELKTRSKMFCSCPNDPAERHPNVNICPICTGQPGVLPVINKEAIEKTLKAGLALNCQVPEDSYFERKNYFYPDLPKGYQISQYHAPLCKEGYLEQVKNKKIRIRRVHLEEDTGRLLHPERADYSLVDFNRAGMPLMELVTEPDLHSAKEARKFAEELQLILRYLDVSEADMEKGEMRVEANISLQRKSQIPNPKSQTNSKFQISNSNLGTKVEIKNLNSFRSLEKAIDYEIKRQTEILSAGKKVVQETRGWHDKKEVTFSQRSKEEAHDYRYFPEPDLPQLHLGIPEELQKIRAEIPELPQERRERFSKEYKISVQDIETFIFNNDLGEFFEKVVSELQNWVEETELKRKLGAGERQNLINLAANYITSDLLGLLRGAAISDESFLITPENFAEFITLLYEGKISSKIAKLVLQEMFEKGGDPSQIIEERGLELISDKEELERVIKEVLAKNQKAVQDYRAGKETALQFLVGQAMARTRGKAEPQTLQKLFRKLL